MPATQTIEAMAQQFGVDKGALSCLLQFLQDNIAKNPAAFFGATDAQRDQIIQQGVKAWRNHSQRMLSELQEGTTEWAQATRQQIASDVWHQVRGLN
jgi:hypothetical protein